MHTEGEEIYSVGRPALEPAMHSPFVDSASSLSGEYGREPLQPSGWGRLLTFAVVLAIAACSAALLVQ
jgi:hypothetical protein